MNFTHIDPALAAWSARHRIPLLTRYQDADVRSFQLVGTFARAQIWLEVNGNVTVYVWDYGKRKQSFVARVATLETSLDKALQVAQSWCGNP
jgi:hypothetical protein